MLFTTALLKIEFFFTTGDLADPNMSFNSVFVDNFIYQITYREKPDSPKFQSFK